MIFTGDVAVANGDRFCFYGFPSYLRSVPMCINLEGSVKSFDIDVGVDCDEVVYNDEAGLASIFDFNLQIPFLANNHIHDLADGVVKTCDFFAGKGIQTIGAGPSLAHAQRAGIVQSGVFNYSVLAFGWPVIGCKPCSVKDAGVNPFNRQNVLRLVNLQLASDPDARIVVVVHGNYEFEPYPQPGHRSLALELIDLGVYAVIFHHPHIVGPIERYKGRAIAYSLGNFAFSQGRFFGGKLAFPERSFHQILVELGDNDVVHHCNFEPPSSVIYERSEYVTAPDISLKAEFEGFSDSQYLAWFKANRHKRKFLPIYKDANHSFLNSVKDMFVLLRQRFIDVAVYFHLKGLKRE